MAANAIAIAMDAIIVVAPLARRRLDRDRLEGVPDREGRLVLDRLVFLARRLAKRFIPRGQVLHFQASQYRGGCCRLRSCALLLICASD
jgi:hypothetical protein